MHSAGRGPYLLSRRALVLGVAGGLAGARLCRGSVAPEISVTGREEGRLAPLDRLMTTFLADHEVPGAALAVTRDGRLVYARGFGLSHPERGTPVEPTSLFRIASVSKPLTAVATLQLVERGKLGLDDRAFAILGLEPHMEPGTQVDPRLERITVRHLLQHTAGWDRDVSFDPIGRVRQISRSLGVPLPIGPEAIIRYMMGRPLDFDPGERFAYSNLGYLVLGRLIARLGEKEYESYIREEVLGPLGVTRPRLGHGAVEERAAGEVAYVPRRGRPGPAVVGPHIGRIVPICDGAENLEGFEAHGGWIASAVDLVRFATAFDRPDACPLLGAGTIATMFERPPGAPGFEPGGRPKEAYYGCGWDVRPMGAGRLNTWHGGLIAGTSALLVRRRGEFCWAVLFNTDSDPKGRVLSGIIDPMVHGAVDAVREWPEEDLFGELLREQS